MKCMYLCICICIYKYIYTKSNNKYMLYNVKKRWKMQFMSTIINNQLLINIYIHNCIHTIGCRMPLCNVLSEWRSHYRQIFMED